MAIIIDIVEFTIAELNKLYLFNNIFRFRHTKRNIILRSIVIIALDSKLKGVNMRKESQSGVAI